MLQNHTGISNCPEFQFSNFSNSKIGKFEIYKFLIDNSKIAEKFENWKIENFQFSNLTGKMENGSRNFNFPKIGNFQSSNFPIFKFYLKIGKFDDLKIGA